MKKKIIGFAFMAIVVLAASWDMKQSNNAVSLSDLTLDNVEALASSEADGGLDWGNHKYKAKGPKGTPCCESGYPGDVCNGSYNRC